MNTGEDNQEQRCYCKCNSIEAAQPVHPAKDNRKSQANKAEGLPKRRRKARLLGSSALSGSWISPVPGSVSGGSLLSRPTLLSGPVWEASVDKSADPDFLR